MSTVARIADTIALGALWVIFSLPVFTMGATSAAFYYAYTKCVRQRMDYSWKTFLAAFKSNFRQATRIWLLVLFLLAVALLDSYLLGQLAAGALWVNLLRAVIVLLTLACVLWGLYLFPYLSRFDVPDKAVMRNCALILLANMPQSLLLLLLFAACALGFICLPILNLLIPALYMFLVNPIFEKIFRKYMRPEDQAAQALADQETIMNP